MPRMANQVKRNRTIVNLHTITHSLTHSLTHSHALSGAKANPAGSKRRALGDITNAFHDDNVDMAAKKPQLSNRDHSEAISEKCTDDRPYMQRPCDDVDARDEDNPLLCTTYVNEMYDHLGEIEQEYMVDSLYMNKQDYVNEKMRTILVDWLVSKILF